MDIKTAYDLANKEIKKPSIEFPNGGRTLDDDVACELPDRFIFGANYHGNSIETDVIVYKDTGEVKIENTIVVSVELLEKNIEPKIIKLSR